MNQKQSQNGKLFSLDNSVGTFQLPSKQFIRQFTHKKFKTLNEAINLVHKVTDSLAKYRLKSFDGKSMHLFQCTYHGCRSYVIFKSNSSVSSQKNITFEVYTFPNIHIHGKGINKVNCPDEQSAKLSINNDLEIVRNILRGNSVLMYFRDFLSDFTAESAGNSLSGQPPYLLPDMVRSKSITLTIKHSYKVLNQKKGTTLVIMQIYLFNQLITQIKNISCLKNSSGSQRHYAYILSLIYIVVNSFKNCHLQIDQETWKSVRQNDKGQSENLFQAIKSITQHFFTVQDSFYRSDHQKSQKDKQRTQLFQDQRYIRQKYIQKDDFVRNSNKIKLKIIGIQQKCKRSLNNKLSMSESIYKQVICGKQWSFIEQKPSSIRKINDLFRLQQKRRAKRQTSQNKYTLAREQQHTQKDNNFILIDDQSQEKQKNTQQLPKEERQNKYVKEQQDFYIKSMLKKVEQSAYYYGYGQKVDMIDYFVGSSQNGLKGPALQGYQLIDYSRYSYQDIMKGTILTRNKKSQSNLEMKALGSNLFRIPSQMKNQRMSSSVQLQQIIDESDIAQLQRFGIIQPIQMQEKKQKDSNEQPEQQENEVGVAQIEQFPINLRMPSELFISQNQLLDAENNAEKVDRQQSYKQKSGQSQHNRMDQQMGGIQILDFRRQKDFQK